MKLGLKPTLKTILAPQLIHSLNLLQLPILKLEQRLRQELATNPLLDEVDTLEEKSESELDLGKEEVEKPEVDRELSKIDWKDYLGEDSDYGYRAPNEREQIREREPTLPAAEKSLYEHLIEQLHFAKLTDDEKVIGEFVIGNIDEGGYLSCSIEEIIETLKSDPEKTRKVLSTIQSFDPPGVGARDLAESLLIQLKEKKLEDGLAFVIVKEHLHELDKKSNSQLARILNTTEEEVQKARDIIRNLSPKPAQGRFVTGASAVVPDMIVEKIDDEYIITHNDKNMPRLRISASYKNLLRKDNASSDTTRAFIKKKLEDARWLLNAINQRKTTMLNVMQAIVEEQKGFFEKGAEELKPLTMEEVAAKVGIDVSTVSRVSKDKYVQTPQGVFEIKYFFTSGVRKETGEEVSTRQVKSGIEELINHENPGSPYSDQDIYNILKQEGFHIARRTVTKYREELGISPARFRKRVVPNSDKKTENSEA